MGDLTGSLTIGENRAFLEGLKLFRLLQQKLMLLICTLQCAPIVDNLVSLWHSPFSMNRYFRQIFPKHGCFHCCLQSAFFVSTTIQNKRNCLPDPLQSTIRTQNKAFKSGMAQDANRLRCDETETIEYLLYDCISSMAAKPFCRNMEYGRAHPHTSNLKALRQLHTDY